MALLAPNQRYIKYHQQTEQHRN